LNYFLGQELSLYKCINCQPIEFEITELNTKSKSIQRLHCYQHLKYEPFICQVKNSEVFCNERYHALNFLKTHLRYEHQTDLPDVQISTNQLAKYFKLEEISEVQKLIDSCLENDLLPINSKNTLQSSRESIQSPKKVVPNASHKRKIDNCDHSMPNKMGKLLPNNEKIAQQNTGKRPRGRPRKITNCQSTTNRSSLRKSTSICSSSTSHSLKSANYDNEDINESSSSSGWNSDTERFEMALSLKNKGSDSVKQYQSQVNKRPNERQVNEKPLVLVKQTGSQVKKGQNQKVGKKQRENDLNINQTELMRSECSTNQNEIREEIIDESTLSSSEAESQLIESSEANASSSDNLPFIKIHQNLNQENMSQTATDLTSSPFSASFHTINNQIIADNLAPNSSYSGIGRY